jgi:cysteine desulfurase
LDTTRLVYADHHATTPLHPEVLEAMLPWLTGLAANPSSIHSAGRAARRAVEDAREEVATALGASPSEIVFTSGGTEADNLAVRGGALAARETEPRRDTVAFTAVEHPAVREAALHLAGFVAAELAVDASGLPAGDALSGIEDGRLALVSAILVNGETGVVNTGFPALAESARAKGAIFHTDAIQAIGKVPVSAPALGVDLLSLTGHKFGGPKGAGALYVRRGIRLAPQNVGGGQEKGRRGGTENIPAIVGLGAAIRIAVTRLAETMRRVGALRDRFERELAAACPAIRVNGTLPGALRVSTASSVTFPGADGETLLVALDLAGIAASRGPACSSGTTSASRVLLAMGIPAADASATLRFSFGASSTEGDVDGLLAVLPALVARATKSVLA